MEQHFVEEPCQEGRHRPVLSFFCQSFHRVFLQAAESGVFSKVRVCEAQRKRELAAWQAEQAHHTANKEKQSVPDGERPVVHPNNLIFTYFYLFAQYLRGWAAPLFDFSSRYITDWQDLP